MYLLPRLSPSSLVAHPSPYSPLRRRYRRRSSASSWQKANAMHSADAKQIHNLSYRQEQPGLPFSKIVVTSCNAGEKPAISPCASHENFRSHVHHVQPEKKKHHHADDPANSSQSHQAKLPSPQAARLQPEQRIEIWTYRHTSRYPPAAISVRAVYCAYCRSCPGVRHRAGGRCCLSRQQIPRLCLSKAWWLQGQAQRVEVVKSSSHRRCCNDGCRSGWSHVECDPRRGRKHCGCGCCCFSVLIRMLSPGFCWACLRRRDVCVCW